MIDLHERQLLQQVGAHIKAVREQKGYSLLYLASKLHTDNSTLDKIEHGEKNITMIMILKLAAALGVRPGELLNVEG